jgi:hypothetical protein
MGFVDLQCTASSIQCEQSGDAGSCRRLLHSAVHKLRLGQPERISTAIAGAFGAVRCIRLTSSDITSDGGRIGIHGATRVALAHYHEETELEKKCRTGIISVLEDRQGVEEKRSE